MSDESWLPPLVHLNDFEGDWVAYLKELERVFGRDFGDPRPPFRGKRMGLKRHPVVNGVSATLWHLISEGKGEDNRQPDLRRAERIAWPRAVLNAAEARDPRVVLWEEADPRRGPKVLVALADFSYLVVVDDRGDYVLLWTAYPTSHEHERRKLRRRYEAWMAGKG
jgi:hypothetical protein